MSKHRIQINGFVHGLDVFQEQIINYVYRKIFLKLFECEVTNGLNTLKPQAEVIDCLLFNPTLHYDDDGIILSLLSTISGYEFSELIYADLEFFEEVISKCADKLAPDYFRVVAVTLECSNSKEPDNP